MIEAMAMPFLACLLLAGIHVYLGIHVLERKVIFVDLALAQIAAFGAVYGVLLGYHLHEDPWTIKGFSLLFAIVGAAAFSITRMRSEKVPHEAIIGITYAVALAATILGSSHLPHGFEEVSALLAGSILWVSKETVIGTAILYVVVGAFHFAFRRKFLAISRATHEAATPDVSVRLWDFFFYLSFGFVVTSSVAIAGVLLVFSFLVIPAVLAMLFAKRVGTRLLVGWSVGTAASFVGCFISYEADLPSGPTIVLSLAGFLVVAAVIHFLKVGRSFRKQLIKVGVGTAAVTLFILITLTFRNRENPSLIEMIRCPAKSERVLAVGILRSDRTEWDAAREDRGILFTDPEPEIRLAMLEIAARYKDVTSLSEIHQLLTDEDDEVREEAVLSTRILQKEESIDPLLDVFAREEDEFIRVEIAETLLELGVAKGIHMLVNLMDHGVADLVRQDAYEYLCAHLDVRFPFQAGVPEEANDEQILPYRKWINEKLENVRFDPNSGIFTTP